MILDAESWMNIRRFRVLHEAGATYAEIGRECGSDWRTVKKYLVEDGVALPPRAPSRAGMQPQKIGPFTEVVDALLRKDITIRASVVHERLVTEHGFTGHYQRVKMYVATARPRIADELDEHDENRLHGLHRRFETVPGAQAQVDWGDEGPILAHVGIGKVYSFHMTLSYSRDPFSCFTTSTDMATFWACHRRAFTHFGGVPGSIVYDRVKTVIRRHVAPGAAVPLHPTAAAFAAHYGFVIDPLAAYRPTGKGRVERQVSIVRDHVLAGRDFDSIAELDAAFTGWLPIRRGQTHRTHGEVIAVRAEADRAALAPLPAAAFLVDDKHLRRVGKDCLISFEASLYSVPARQIRAGQTVELRVLPDIVAIHALDGRPLARHARAAVRGSWVVDPAHWDGLPDGHTRATVIELPHRGRTASDAAVDAPLAGLLPHRRRPDVTVASRPLADYAAAAQAGSSR
ncbi:MAG TPA: IS21 family transposase [Mycobacteriales bacterium]|jgi:transposase|nr:IS21 family transposase [Mycobacteriales bacterium]